MCGYHSEMLRAERQQHMTKDRVGQSGKRLAPFSLRLTFEERAKIESHAGNMPIGAYIKSVLLTEDAPKYRTRKKGPVSDQVALAIVLAKLGESRFASNLNQLARAANIGSFVFDEDSKRLIDDACVHITEIRALLLSAFGMDEAENSAPPVARQPRASQAFQNPSAKAEPSKGFRL